MHFSCTQENLLHCANLTSRIASRAGNLPILSHLHIKAEVEGITIKATNLEVGVTCALRGKVEKAGEFTVPAKLFTDYITFLPKETVELILEEQTLMIRCGRHHTKIKGLPASDFPLIPTIEGGVQAQVSLAALVEGLEQVLLTISPTEARPEISGVFLRLQGTQGVLAGTDSYRLAEKILPVAGAEGQPGQAIIPLRALQELARICAQEQEAGSIKLIISPSQFAAILPTVEFVSRVIEGQYPDYRAIIPGRFGTQIKISRADFVAAIKAAGLFSKAGVYDIGVEAIPERGVVKVAALNSQTGEHESTLEAEVKGTATKIAFNWKYLLDGLQALQGGELLLQVTDASSPAMLTEAAGGDYFYIVMPIKE